MLHSSIRSSRLSSSPPAPAPSPLPVDALACGSLVSAILLFCVFCPGTLHLTLRPRNTTTLLRGSMKSYTYTECITTQYLEFICSWQLCFLRDHYSFLPTAKFIRIISQKYRKITEKQNQSRGLRWLWVVKFCHSQKIYVDHFFWSHVTFYY